MGITETLQCLTPLVFQSSRNSDEEKVTYLIFILLLAGDLEADVLRARADAGTGGSVNASFASGFPLILAVVCWGNSFLTGLRLPLGIMIGFDSSLTDFFLLLEDDVVLDRATALGFFSVVDFLLKVIFALFFLNSKSLSESSSDLYFDFSSSDASVGHFSSEDSSELPEITYLLEVIFFDERFELTELDALADFFGFDDF